MHRNDRLTRIAAPAGADDRPEAAQLSRSSCGLLCLLCLDTSRPLCANSGHSHPAKSSCSRARLSRDSPSWSCVRVTQLTQVLF